MLLNYYNTIKYYIRITVEYDVFLNLLREAFSPRESYASSNKLDGKEFVVQLQAQL
jgi:hypothetical protein